VIIESPSASIELLRRPDAVQLGDSNRAVALQQRSCRRSDKPRAARGKLAHLESRRADFRLGRQFLEARKARKLTQREAAALAGINQGDLSRIERGNGNPTLRTLTAVADVVEMEIRLAPRTFVREKRAKKTSIRARDRAR
jgi:DNA-binding XRE family transcriptional regulator